MKTSTIIWAKFESPGTANSEVMTHGTMGEVVKEFARWMMITYMGHYSKVTIARSESELLRFSNTKHKETTEELMDELLSLLDQPELPQLEDDSLTGDN